jgi:flagellar export protein FliJ
MKHDYQTLIRLNKFKVDECSRILLGLQSESQKLKDQDTTLAAKLEYEREAAKQSLEASALFGPFANNISKQRRAIAGEQRRLATRISDARDNLRAAMGEVKKYEIAQANARAAEAQEEAARESNRLDEAAIEGFRRKENESS